MRTVSKNIMLLLVGVIAVAITPAIASACRLCGRQPCGACAAPCVSYQLVERTVYVPQTFMEQRTVSVVQCRPETRQRTVTVYRRVAETTPVTQAYTVMVPQQRTRQETYTVCKPVWSEQEQQYTVQVPHVEKRTGVRTMCKPVMVEQKRTVCRDAGRWEERPCPTQGCCEAKCRRCCLIGCCCVCSGCGVHRVWVPNIVQEEQTVTVCKMELVEEPYECTVTVCKPEIRTRSVQVCRYETEQRTREVAYTVCVPEVRTRTCNVVTYRCVPEQRQVSCTVMVPHVVQKVVTVPVCRMVPKQVTCRVPVCSSCGGCQSCCR